MSNVLQGNEVDEVEDPPTLIARPRVGTANFGNFPPGRTAG